MASNQGGRYGNGQTSVVRQKFPRIKTPVSDTDSSSSRPSEAGARSPLEDISNQSDDNRDARRRSSSEDDLPVTEQSMSELSVSPPYPKVSHELPNVSSASGPFEISKPEYHEFKPFSSQDAMERRCMSRQPRGRKKGCAVSRTHVQSTPQEEEKHAQQTKQIRELNAIYIAGVGSRIYTQLAPLHTGSTVRGAARTSGRSAQGVATHQRNTTRQARKPETSTSIFLPIGKTKGRIGVTNPARETPYKRWLAERAPSPPGSRKLHRNWKRNTAFSSKASVDEQKSEQQREPARLTSEEMLLPPPPQPDISLRTRKPVVVITTANKMAREAVKNKLKEAQALKEDQR